MEAAERKKGGLVFALPWLIGLSLFTVYPFCASIYYSFTDYSVLQSPVFVGADNYVEMWNDDVFWKVLGNTLYYVALLVPCGLLVSLSLALMMNATNRGQAIYSVIFYMPFLVGPTVTSILWLWIYNGEYGLLNSMLRPFFSLLGLPFEPPQWLSNTSWALPALVFMALWGTGQTAFIYLAKLQDVPQDLYEAAEIDGANAWQKTWHITLPMISPIIFFNIIMAIIGGFQVFTEPYIMTEGGPNKATYLLPAYIWDNAFKYMRMGYACALSWILFLIILVLTLVAFRLSRDRVHYTGR